MNRAWPPGMIPRHVRHRRRGPAILFDLDGTLIEPAGGITGGIAHALQAAGLAPPDETTLRAMVGPKLPDALLTHTAATPEQIPEIIATYRSWYAETGLAMGKVYPGSSTCSTPSSTRGSPSASPPKNPKQSRAPFLENTAFTSTSTSSPERRMGKASHRHNWDPRQAKRTSSPTPLLRSPPPPAVMIGDRAQDVEGAHANNIACIGAGWGYGSPGELDGAGAVFVLPEAREITPQLLLMVIQHPVNLAPRVTPGP